MSDMPSWYTPTNDASLGLFIEEEIKKASGANSKKEAYAALNQAEEYASSIKNDLSKEVYLYNIKAMKYAISSSSFD